ncbi:uncharacterized protein LOC134242685 [Saccostrea cucullata]|uniref:uncharacterized protein LOC134242685 n=1 Tax=Saccostrea cuccullata TaxID=36930 RepID=UPI002ED3EBAA
MASFGDSDDSDGEIPEIDLSLKISPFMFEPVAKLRASVSSNSESESEDSDNHDNDSGQSGNSLQGQSTENWCLCSNCVTMPTNAENKCCQRTNIVDAKIEEESLQCITQHEGFIANCLNRYVLETSFYEYIQESGPLEENEHVHE